MPQSLVIEQFVPQTTVTFYYGGQQNTVSSVDDDLILWTTQRTTSGQPGQWTVTLTDRFVQGHSWAQEIPRMAYVEIRAGNTAQRPLPIRMRGFVTSPTRSWTIGQTGGPSRNIVIAGEDYTALFYNYSVQYLWQMMTKGSQKEMAVLSFGLSYNYGLPMTSLQPRQFLEALLQHIFLNPAKGYLPHLQAAMSSAIPGIAVHCTVPNAVKLPTTTIQSWQGPLWDLLSYFATAPLTEFFIFDDVEEPVLTFRIPPFYDMDRPNTLATPAVAPYLDAVTLDPAQVSGSHLGFSSQEVLNFFLTWPDNTGSSVLPTGMVNFLKAGKNPLVDTASMDVFGYRPLTVTTPLVGLSPTQGSLTQLQALAEEFTAYLYATQHQNQDLASGTITVHGQPEWIPGRYLDIPDVGRYYLQGVSEQFQAVGAASPSWLATLSVVRGQVSSLDVVPDLGG